MAVGVNPIDVVLYKPLSNHVERVSCQLLCQF
jgi:hypothetical protein